LLGAIACGGAREIPGVESVNHSIRFVDEAEQFGIDVESTNGGARKNHIVEAIGSGIAIADYDLDGDDDVYVATAQTSSDWTTGKRPNANSLYRNNDDGTFTEVAADSGVALRAWSNGVYFVDYDNDGDRDLFVTCWGSNVLYRNEGDGTFADVTSQAGVAGDPEWWSSGAAFGDLDLDGDLDLYVTNYLKYDLSDPAYSDKVVWKQIVVLRGPHGYTAQPDVLYRNNGDGTFTDVSEPAGLLKRNRDSYGLAVAMSDLDEDGDPDIYVANDSHANFLWRNDGEFNFTDVAVMSGVATNEDAKEQAGMGVDIADYDGDLDFDVVVTNFSNDWNTLYNNLGHFQFQDETFRAGFRDSYMNLVWGTKFFDYDNDGWLDVFMANGHIYPEVDDHEHLNTTYRQQNSLYRNQRDGTFENVSDTTGPGMQIVDVTRGLALTDIDHNGSLDLLLTNLDGRPNVLLNNGNANGWIRFRLQGTTSNRDAVGARLTITAGDRTRVAEVSPFGSFLSQGSYDVHFGLDELDGIDQLTITWPGGDSEDIGALEGRRLYSIVQGRGVVPESDLVKR
jgi:hypothetical protein